MTFDDASENHGTLMLEGGRTIRYIGRDALIRNKETSRRPQDLADVARLRKQTNSER